MSLGPFTHANQVRAFGRADFTGTGAATNFAITIPTQPSALYVALVTMVNPAGLSIAAFVVLSKTTTTITVKFAAAPILNDTFSLDWAVLL